MLPFSIMRTVSDGRRRNFKLAPTGTCALAKARQDLVAELTVVPAELTVLPAELTVLLVSELARVVTVVR